MATRQKTVSFAASNGASSASVTRDGGFPRVVSSVVIEAILDAAESEGVETRPLLAELGLDRDLIRGTDHLISGELEESLWAALIAKTGDRGFGLAVAKALGHGAFRGVEYLGRTSDTLGTALERLVRFNRLLHGVEIFSLGTSVGEARQLYFESPHWENTVIASHVAEFALGSVVVLGRDATGVDWAPNRVRFAHEAPDDLSAHEALFRCPLEFGRPTNAMRFEKRTLDMRMRDADPELCSVLERCLQQTVSEFRHDPGVADATRQAIVLGLREGTPGLEQVARRIGFSRRALQRRLRQENVTFNELLDDVRVNLARRHLARGLSVPEIAMLLGYSDASAFQRAFKRWTGMTPAEYRRRVLLDSRLPL